jgi:hypothetical protein
VKIQLWGLPASGTTIIVRYFHSLPSAFFLTEPIQRILGHRLDPEIELERELAESKATLKGFKECTYEPDMAWFNRFRRKADWTTIGMIRNPIDNWGSMLGFGWGIPERPVDLFLSFAIPFLKTIGDHPLIVYEKFCEDPAREVERASGIKPPKDMALLGMSHSFGNPTAHRSSSVEVIPASPIPDSDRAIIEKSGVMDLYEQLAQANPGLVPGSR